MAWRPCALCTCWQKLALLEGSMRRQNTCRWGLSRDSGLSRGCFFFEETGWFAEYFCFVCLTERPFGDFCFIFFGGVLKEILEKMMNLTLTHPGEGEQTPDDFGHQFWPPSERAWKQGDDV